MVLTADTSQNISPGAQFGRLCVLSQIRDLKQHLCRCECGKELIVTRRNLIRGVTKSCGCLSGKTPLNIGDKYGLLTVVAEAPSRAHHKYWQCLCECGNKTETTTKFLRGGHTKSCGCLVKTHGKSHTKIYQTWRGMKKRTRNPNDSAYFRYGGRGIKMCDRWFDSFENFLADMGEPPTPGHSIDRIDGDGHYEPGNCRWATAEVQNQNRRDYNTRLTSEGKTQTLAEWSRELSINQTTITQRLYKYGWSVEKTLSTIAAKKDLTPLTFNGKTQSYRAWEKELGLNRDMLRNRIKAGWPIEKALSHKAGSQNKSEPRTLPVAVFNPAALARSLNKS